MRTGTLYIDGNDAYRQFGVSVVKGGYDDIIAMPPLKKPQTNDWQEEDGIEADLEEPVLDAREKSGIRLLPPDIPNCVPGILSRNGT